jgi:secondary thiamine-phosphate synthase enzyme
MLQKIAEIKINTEGQRLINVSGEIKRFVDLSGIELGLLNICILHTSASLVLQENASRDVLKDLLNFYDKIVPMNEKLYYHSLEGKDDMPAHIKTTLTNTNLTLSIVNGKLKLGIWQGVFLFEHRLENHSRSIFCHIIGEK